MKDNKILTTVTFILVFVLTMQKSLAADIEIVCDEKVQNTSSLNCEVTSSNTTLFNEQNWAPGSTSFKTLHITNKDKQDTCNLRMRTLTEDQEHSYFTRHIFTAITRGSDNIYGQVSDNKATDTKKLSELLNGDTVNMGKVQNDNGTAEYQWYATFDPESDDTLQRATVSFDIEMNFTCEDESTDDHGDPQKKITNNKPATPTPPLPPIIRNIVSLPATIANVAGAAIQAPTLIKEQPPEVEGAQTTACTQPWFIWVIIALQVLIQAAINKLVKKDRPLVLYTLNLLTMAISGFVIYKLACSWIYNVVALVLGIVMLVLRKRD